MKSIAVILSLAISSLALSPALARVFATRMNGNCCMSSDGGFRFRSQLVMRHRAIPHTCSAYAASCISDTVNKPDHIQMCMSARALCLQTGVHVGPYSGFQYADLARR